MVNMASPVEMNSNKKTNKELIKQLYSSPEHSGSEENIYGDLTSNGLLRIKAKEQKDLLQCPTPGCDGLGHISGNYATHRSLSGCPHADRAMVAALHQELKCPTPGCDGSGHITGNYTSHRSLSGCPRANKKRVLSNNNMNGNNKKETGSESVHSNQSENDNLKPDNDSYLFGKSNKIEYYSNNSAINSADSNDSMDSKSPNKLNKLINQNNCPTPGCDGRGHITGSFLRHRSVSGCPRVNSSVCVELQNNYNAAVKRNCPMYSDDEESPETMFIRERCLKSDQPAPKDVNELKEKSKQFELELLKLKSEFNDINSDYDTLRNENSNIHQEATELRKYYETLQIDLISLLDEVDLPEMNEKLSIYNFNDYISKLEKFFIDFKHEKQESNLSEQKRMTLNLLKKAFLDYKIPKLELYKL